MNIVGPVDGFTVTVTIDVTVAQPLILSVTFSWNVLELVRVATGLAIVASFNPAEGVHKYVKLPDPPDALGVPPRVVPTPSQTERFAPASAVGLS